MPERVLPGPVPEDASIREAVCIHTSKIYDSCKDKDCVEDLRLYPTCGSAGYIDDAISVRAKSAELLFTSIDVDEVTFNRGFYTVDVRYFYKVRGEAFSLVNKSNEFCGLAIFNKRVVLFGSEGSAKIFSSRTARGSLDKLDLARTNLPTAIVEAVDPIVLDMKLVEGCDVSGEFEAADIPGCVCACFNSELTTGESKRVYVTLGQFSIIRLERDSQLLIPSYDYCMPEKECIGPGDDDPCSLFSRISFPVNEFFPPDTVECPEGYRDIKAELAR